MGPWRAMLGRELLESSRRPRTWTLRWVSGAVAVAALMGVTWVGGGGMTGARWSADGRAAFVAVGGLTALWALFVGCQKTADSLGKERREGTLGLLFLTDMKGWDVVLGKLAGAGVDLLLQLAAAVPVLVVPLLMGGVSVAQVGWLVAGLMGALLMSLAAGLLASLVSQDPRQATGLAVAWLLAMLLVPLALFLLLVNLEQRVPENVAMWVLLPCPAIPFVQAFGGTLGWPLAATAVLVQAWISWRVLAWTARWVRTAWQEGGRRTWRTRWIEWLNRVRFGGPAARRRWQERWLAVGAWEWLSLRERWKPVLPWVLTAVAFGLWLANVGQLGWQDVAATATGILSLLFHGLFALWVAGEAGITLHEQRTSGASELLLTSGLSASDILGGQGRVLRRMLLGPLACVTALDVLVLVWVPTMDLQWSHVALGWWTHLACAVLTPFVWVGMRWSTTLCVLEGKAINAAVGRAAGKALIWPGVAFFGVAGAWAGSGYFSGRFDTSWAVAWGALPPTVLMASWLAWRSRLWRQESEAIFRDGMGGGRKRPA